MQIGDGSISAAGYGTVEFCNLAIALSLFTLKNIYARGLIR
ncbi:MULTISPECIES: hypothetical protein [Fischerella]|nr:MULTISPECIES: hypothetical protein [Fischerella]